MSNVGPPHSSAERSGGHATLSNDKLDFWAILKTPQQVDDVGLLMWDLKPGEG